MRLNVSDSLLLAAFAILCVGSFALKASAGPPKGAAVGIHSTPIDELLVNLLQRQGYVTEVRSFRERSALVLARRGGCRLAARNATGGTMYQTIFATDAAPVGRMRYLYRGSSYSASPTVALRLGRLETEVRSRFGMPAPVSLVVALATSPECGGRTFGLENLSVPA